MTNGELLPAVQYLRSSNPTQEYSIANQEEAIRKYAISNGFRIVRTYLDSGTTGVVLRKRPALKRLLEHVNSGHADFRAILTYDISRWGRFQDTDESASYEFLCKRAGIRVHYCAEEFPNDGGASSSIMKILKRIMAAEYSREISVKVSAGQRRLAGLGFHMGGPAPYGLERVVITPRGSRKQTLGPGDRKGSPRYRVVLVPGRKSEVACVRQIFSMAVRKQKTPFEIASALNAAKIDYRNQTWTEPRVRRILNNAVYAGNAVWGQTTQKIQGRTTRLPRSEWIIVEGIYSPIVDAKTFEQAHSSIRSRRIYRKKDEELLCKLKHLLKERGHLSTNIINGAPGISKVTTYRLHFGSLHEAYKRIGYSASARIVKSTQTRAQTKEIRQRLFEHLQRLFPNSLKIIHPPAIRLETIAVDEKIHISFFLCRALKVPVRNRSWVLHIRDGERQNLALIALLDSNSPRIRAFHLLPPLGNSIGFTRYFRENDSRFDGGEKLGTLADLCTVARRVSARFESKSAPDDFGWKGNGATFVAKQESPAAAIEPNHAPSHAALIPVAQYVRMSTDRQENSTESQKNAMAKFADQHGMQIVRTYQDLGKSGLQLKHRPELGAMMRDVLKGNVPFKAILVFDVSRWGRFQDPDESAHYEFLCRTCGMPVYYCSELFSNEVTLENSALKSMKRVMAAEFSRELSIKVVQTAEKCIGLGYRLGSIPGFGYRRLEVTADGVPRQRLDSGEHKYFQGDHVILVPGPKSEVNLVRRIFRDVIKSRKGYAEIAQELNQAGLTRDGNLWTDQIIRNLLTNPKYAGHNVWNRSSGRLGMKRVKVAPEHWIVQPDAFAPVVSPDIFDLAQKRRRTWADRRWSDEEIINALENLARSKGKLTERLLKKTPGMPHQDMLRKRFGSCRNSWGMVGYELPKQYRLSGTHYANGQLLRKAVLKQITDLFPDRAKTFHLDGQLRRLLKVDEEVIVSVLFGRRERTSYGKLRWLLTPIPQERDYITLVCLPNRNNTKVCRYYVLPSISLQGLHRIKKHDPWLAKGICLRGLSEFYKTVQTVVRAHEMKTPSPQSVNHTVKHLETLA